MNISRQQWNQAFAQLGWGDPLPQQIWQNLAGQDYLLLDWPTVYNAINGIGWSDKHAEMLWLALQTPPATPQAPVAPQAPQVAADPWSKPAEDPWRGPAAASAPADAWGQPHNPADASRPSTTQSPAPSGNMVPASWFMRLLGRLVDQLIIGLFSIPIGIVAFIMLQGALTTTKNPMTGQVSSFKLDYTQIITALLIPSILYLLVIAGYEIFTQTKRSRQHSGETIGKQVVKVRVVKERGGAVDTRTVVMREFVGKGLAFGLGGFIITTIIGMVFPPLSILGGLFWFAWWWIICPVRDPYNRCPHDKIAKTRPVESSYTP